VTTKGKCDICGKAGSPLVQCGGHWHFACKNCLIFIDHGARPDRWICDTCKTEYAEYVNGCPHCQTAGIRSRVESLPGESRKSETLSETRQKFEVVKQGELSYVVVLDGECVDEFTDEISAKEYVRWFAGKLNAARLQGLEEAAKIAEKQSIAWDDSY
jgi:hypothetical protein